MGAWSEPILHVDMDAFFVEVERLRHPHLANRPVVVGGDSARAVVASASYEARAFGVHSAMPMVRAKRICPRLVVVPADHAEYGRISTLVFAVFSEFTPLVEGLSVDEAFLDVGGLRRHFSDSPAVGQAVRSAIRERLGLPCSVGVAATKFVAKLASAQAKPDGLLHVPAEDQVAFIHSLPLTALWGVGPATLAALSRLGITTVAELAGTDPLQLGRALGGGLAHHLLDLAQGRDPRQVETGEKTKSISTEETFQVDLTDRDDLGRVLRVQADRVAGRLRSSGLRARTITVKIRFSDFRTITRSETLASPTSNDLDVFRTATRLLAGAIEPGQALRLLGTACSGLEPAGVEQLDLDQSSRRDDLDQAVDAIRARFGSGTIGPATPPDHQIIRSQSPNPAGGSYTHPHLTTTP
jgi:DNA polymerase-4